MCEVGNLVTCRHIYWGHPRHQMLCQALCLTSGTDAQCARARLADIPKLSTIDPLISKWRPQKPETKLKDKEL